MARPQLRGFGVDGVRGLMASWLAWLAVELELCIESSSGSLAALEAVGA